VLAVNYQPEAMVKYLADCEKELGIKIVMSKEDEPMGTAGPLALARKHLSDASNFFVLNSDVICEFPLQAMLDFHVAHGHEGTIMVTRVQDWSKYGVVVFDEVGTQGIQRFVEKPQEFVGDKINSGIYIFKPEILNRIELKPTSIEREIFPAMASDNQLHAFVLPGYWMDVRAVFCFVFADFWINWLLFLIRSANRRIT
jgi:mannose-1-phosphate guanylyltransferase